MYFLDPDRGARRRTHARNQMIHASHAVRDNARAQLLPLWQAAEDVDNRGVARTRNRRVTVRRVASVLASAASLGLVARAAINGRVRELEFHRPV